MKKKWIAVSILLLLTWLVACSREESIDIDEPAEISEPTETVITAEYTEPNTPEPTLDSINIITKYGTRNGDECLILSTSLDLDGDGIDERIAAYFLFSRVDYMGNPVDFVNDYCCSEIEITDGNDDVFTASPGCTTYQDPALHFADFDIRDSLIQFYVEGDGHYDRDCPYTKIFSYDGAQIIENIFLPGNVTSYDGFGKIYSIERYSINCFYDLYSGLTLLPKENIIGTEIRRNISLLLMALPETEYTRDFESSSYERDDWEYVGLYEDDFICLVPPDTPLVVLDIKVVEGFSWQGIDTWLKVQTPDGSEGWFCIVYWD